MRVLHVGWGFTPWRGNDGLIEYAEDLMSAQASSGLEVAYFFTGRHYPFQRQPRLKRWNREGVRMYELLDCVLPHAGELGTTNPEGDLNEGTSEQAFKKVLDEWQPHLIHIQELAGLPSSLIEIANSRAVPVVMTLHNYFLLCPTVKLFDYEKKVCLTKDVGSRCCICCGGAPSGRSHLVRETYRFWAINYVLRFAILHLAAKWTARVVRFGWRFIAGPRRAQPVSSTPRPRVGQENAYQRRREVNVDRLNKVDMLLSQSHRVAEIYRDLGVHAERIKTVQSTVQHLGRIRPAILDIKEEPLTFGSLNGCASTTKGAEIVLSALRRLKEMGLNEKFRLIIMGGIQGSLRQDFLDFSNVIHRGSYDRNKLDHSLWGIQVGVVSSIWEEIYGYVGIEFLAKGIPVIGNKIGGIVDYVVPGQTGWLNAEKSGEGLANIMASLIRSPEQILSMNRNIVANHDRIIKKMDVHVAEIDTIYRQVLRHRGSPAIT